MPISLLTVFSSSGEKNTSGLTQADGFPAAQKPARQWFNWLFNAYSAKINEIAGQVNTNTTDLSNLGTKAQLVDLIYPVGSIIEFNNTVNPNTQFAGTTWVPFGEGRVTVGLSDEVSDPLWTKAIGNTHGEFEHTLTIDEIPPIEIDITLGSSDVGNTLPDQGQSGGSDTIYNPPSVGGGDPHENVQPSIVVARWVRTA